MNMSDTVLVAIVGAISAGVTGFFTMIKNNRDNSSKDRLASIDHYNEMAEKLDQAQNKIGQLIEKNGDLQNKIYEKNSIIHEKENELHELKDNILKLKNIISEDGNNIEELLAEIKRLSK